eukprot:1682739-Amphidinium_carterae.10
MSLALPLGGFWRRPAPCQDAIYQQAPWRASQDRREHGPVGQRQVPAGRHVRQRHRSLLAALFGPPAPQG